jgi:protein-tyrosine-phosphatase
MPMTVLFLCDDNARLSPMAEAYLNTVGEGRIRAFSAGIAPAPALAYGVVHVLGESGIEDAELEPKSWELFCLPHAPVPDVVVGLTPAALYSTRKAWPVATRLLDWRLGAEATGRLVGKEALRAAFRRLRGAIDTGLAGDIFGPAGLAMPAA